MGRFTSPQDPLFQRLNSSVSFDYRLAPYDLELSGAHARMLASREIISAEDLAEIERGLSAIKAEIDDDSFRVEPSDEDIHMAIERRLIELIGPVGGKLHTARSRNDQVATDVALFVRAHALGAKGFLVELMKVLVERAEEHLDWRMPAYTHLQRAQPVYLSHHLLAYFWKFRRDLERFDFVMGAADAMPLGAGALAGVNFLTDRVGVARELGFGRVAENSMDAVSNRDFVLDYLAAGATCSTHLSQLGAEIVLWSSQEFAFAELADAFASGSSIMPQKKNPDAAELLRAKAPRVLSHYVHVQGMLHGLPLTYNKDLQEDKEPLFDAVDTLELTLSVAREMVRTLRFDRDAMAMASSDEFLGATDLADLLVRRGVPFRESHGMVAGLVRRAVERGGRLSDLTDADVAELAPVLDEAPSARCSGPPSGSSRRCPRAGPRSSGCASSWAGRGPFCARPPASVLDQSFYARPVVEVARDLIGCVVRHGDAAGRIVETEAYHQEEPACHAWVGLTARTRPLFGPAGYAYVYRSYGIHAMLNTVTSEEGEGAAVLIRALEPLEGIDLMRARRGLERVTDLCSGPGKLTQALGIGLELNETSLLGDGPIEILPRTGTPPRIVASERIGITRPVELPWRFTDANSRRFVSAPRPPELRAA